MHISEETCTAYTCAYLCQAAPQVGQWTCEVVVAQVQHIQLQQAQNQSLNQLRSVLGHMKWGKTFAPQQQSSLGTHICTAVMLKLHMVHLVSHIMVAPYHKLISECNAICMSLLLFAANRRFNLFYQGGIYVIKLDSWFQSYHNKHFNKNLCHTIPLDGEPQRRGSQEALMVQKIGKRWQS